MRLHVIQVLADPAERGLAAVLRAACAIVREIDLLDEPQAAQDVGNVVQPAYFGCKCV